MHLVCILSLVGSKFVIASTRENENVGDGQLSTPLHKTNSNEVTKVLIKGRKDRECGSAVSVAFGKEDLVTLIVNTISPFKI